MDSDKNNKDVKLKVNNDIEDLTIEDLEIKDVSFDLNIAQNSNSQIKEETGGFSTVPTNLTEENSINKNGEESIGTSDISNDSSNLNSSTETLDSGTSESGTDDVGYNESDSNIASSDDNYDDRSLKEKVQDLKDNVNEAKENLKDAKEKIKNLPEDIKNKKEDIQKKAEKAKENIQNLPENAKKKAQDVKNKARDAKESLQNFPKSKEELGSAVKDRLKKSAQRAKDKARDTANKAMEKGRENLKDRIENSKPVKAAKKAKKAVKKAKKTIKTTKKVVKGAVKVAKKVVNLAAKAIKGLIDLIVATTPISEIVIAVVLVVALVIVAAMALAPGKDDINDSNEQENYSEKDLKTLEKLRELYKKYPNADAALAMITVVYPYYESLQDGNVTYYINTENKNWDPSKTYQDYEDISDYEDSEEQEDEETCADDECEAEVGDDIYLELFRKWSYRRKFKKLLKKSDSMTEDEFIEYLKNDYFKSESGFKALFDMVDKNKHEEFSNAIIENLKENKNLFINYVYKNAYTCAANLQSAGTVEIDDMLKGNILVDVKVPSCKSGSGVWDCESMYSSPITLEQYAKGGTYEEFNTMDVEKAAAQMIAIKSFVIARSKSMGWGVRQDSNGNYVVTVRNNTNDLVYCDIDLGCKSGNTMVGDGNAKRDPISDAQRNVFDQAWEKAKNSYIYDKSKTTTVGAFCQNRTGVCNFCKKGSCLAHQELDKYVNTTYETILSDQYSNLQLIKVEGDYAITMISNGINCMGSNASVDDSKFVYFSQNDYYNVAFCGRKLEKSILYCNGNNNSICTSGCGLTSISMVAATLTQNTSITPVYLNSQVRIGTDCGPGITGSVGGNMFPYIGNKYNLTVTSISRTEESIKSALDEGALIITSVCGGFKNNNSYTKGTCGGHFIVVRGYEQNNVIISDPYQNTALKNYNNCLSKREDGACTKLSMNFDTFMSDLNSKNGMVYKIMGPTPFYNLGTINTETNNIEVQ